MKEKMANILTASIFVEILITVISMIGIIGAVMFLRDIPDSLGIRWLLVFVSLVTIGHAGLYVYSIGRAITDKG